jgi:hypothetical protein
MSHRHVVKRDNRISIVNPQGATRIVVGSQGLRGVAGPPGDVPTDQITADGTVNVADDVRGYQVEDTVAGDVTFNLGPSGDRNDVPFTVALVGADPITYVIKVVFDGSEECRGEGEFVFTAPYQVVTFYPLAAGGGYYIG